MRSTPLLLLPLLVLLAGCSDPGPAPSPTRALSSSAVPATPLAEPTPLPGEIARGELGPTTAYRGKGDLPRGTRAVYVHAGCSGPAGSSMHYELRDGRGARFGPAADVVCGEGFGVAGSTLAGERGTRVQVLVEGDPGVTGYAVLSTSAER